jgi:large subunit ribosomal protein L10
VVFASADPVAPAKALKHFSDDVKKLDVKAAYVDGAILDAKQVGALAALPSKVALQATLLGLLSSPLRGFVGVLAANPSGFVRVLSAREKQLAESAS